MSLTSRKPGEHTTPTLDPLPLQNMHHRNVPQTCTNDGSIAKQTCSQTWTQKQCDAFGHYQRDLDHGILIKYISSNLFYRILILFYLTYVFHSELAMSVRIFVACLINYVNIIIFLRFEQVDLMLCFDPM